MGQVSFDSDDVSMCSISYVTTSQPSANARNASRSVHAPETEPAMRRSAGAFGSGSKMRTSAPSANTASANIIPS